MKPRQRKPRGVTRRAPLPPEVPEVTAQVVAGQEVAGQVVAGQSASPPAAADDVLPEHIQRMLEAAYT